MEMRTAFCVYGNECEYAHRSDVHWSDGRNALVALPYLRVYDAQVELDASSHRCSACLCVLVHNFCFGYRSLNILFRLFQISVCVRSCYLVDVHLYRLRFTHIFTSLALENLRFVPTQFLIKPWWLFALVFLFLVEVFIGKILCFSCDSFTKTQKR